MPPKKSEPTKKSEPKKSSSSSSKPHSQSDNSDSDDDNDDVGDNEDVLSKLSGKALGLYQWFKATRMAPAQYDNHFEAFKRIKDNTWVYDNNTGQSITETKPTINEFKKYFDELINLNLLVVKRFGTTSLIYCNDTSNIVTKATKIATYDYQIEGSNQFIQRRKNELVQVTVGREETDERNALLQEKIDLEAQIINIDDEMLKYRDNDPEVIGELESYIEAAVNGVDYWTQGICALHSFYKNRDWQGFDGTLQSFVKQFGLNDDFDDVPRFKRKTPGFIITPIQFDQHGKPLTNKRKLVKKKK